MLSFRLEKQTSKNVADTTYHLIKRISLVDGKNDCKMNNRNQEVLIPSIRKTYWRPRSKLHCSASGEACILKILTCKLQLF